MIVGIYVGFLVLMSLITMFMYYSDKRKAIKNKWRTPEKVLLSLSFFGGALGGLFSLYVIRHKNKHWYFVAINFLGLIVQIAILIALITLL